MSDRLERVRRRLTPAVRGRIAASIADNTLPRPLLGALSQPAIGALVNDSAPMEGVPIAALEAIVQRTGRPPMLIQNDKVVLEPLDDFPAGTDVKIHGVEKWIPSVGRVEFLNYAMTWGGTGWVIDQKDGASLIVTNRHVASLVAKRAADGTGVFLRNGAGIRYGCNVDFGEEAGGPANDTSRTTPIASIAYLADDLAADLALLRVTTCPFNMPVPVPLAATPGKTGDLVALMGYPAFDPRNNVSDQARYFHDLYDVKRFSPGFVMQALTGATTLSHDCTSLGGNSGSPLIRLDDSAVVGIHFSGIYGQSNSAVGVDTLKQLLAGQTTMVANAGQTVEGRADGVHTADHFAGRAGFSTAFLKHGAHVIATPWPGIEPGAAAGLAKPSDNPAEPNELRYTHFGVKYSGREKLPLITAVNIDGAHTVRIKRKDDQWFVDMRVPPEEQLRAENYGEDIDRGHMVRREDPNWGSAEVAAVADLDTFHYVNAAPQHSLLNQGKTLWAGLENYILDSARTAGFKACVFTGPVLGEDDPTIDDAHVPLEFWKLVATLDADRKALRATAYLLSQGQLVRKLLEDRSSTEANEGLVLGEYRTFQISIADLAAGTGHDFSAYLAADPLRQAHTESVIEDVIVKPLDDLSDMVL